MDLSAEVIHGKRSSDLVFEVEPAATFGDLADAISFLDDAPKGGTFQIQRTGQTPRRDDRVADTDFRSGDRLTYVDAINAVFSATPEAFGANLVVTDSHGSETIYPLRYGDNSLGRDLDNDIVVKDAQVSRHHARITVSDIISVADLGSKNGVVIDDKGIVTPTVLRPGRAAMIGDLTLTIRDHVRAVEAVASRNRVEFNRPPRITRPYEGREVEIPAPPERPRKQRLPMISALLPAAMGVLFLFVSGWVSAIFFLMTPLLVIGSTIEQKRSGVAEFKEDLAAHKEIVAEMVADLDRERIVEIQSRFRDQPAATELPGFVRSLSDRLWERGPEDPDYLRLRVGTAALPSRMVVRIGQGGARDLQRELQQIPQRYAMLDDVPLAIDLMQVGGVGISGPMASSRAMARSFLLQLATLHTPADLSVVALVGDAAQPDWEFLKWLPHARSLGGEQLAATSHHALGLVNSLLRQRVTMEEADSIEMGSKGLTLPAVVVLIDETCPVEPRRLTPLLDARPLTGLFFIWVGSARHRLPRACGAIVEIEADAMSARTGFRDSGLVVEPTRWEGMSHDDAVLTARSLTPVVDIRSRINDDSEIPSQVPYPDLYGGTPILDDTGAILELWQQKGEGGDRFAIRTIVGMQAGSPLVLDIRQDGPHALVAGTTGAGKSEFLQTFVTGMATLHGPERVTFLLVDYKGGAAFKECVELPHCVGLVTDLDRNGVRRALTSLNAEIHFRELLLNKADAKDLIEMERKGHPETPPALIIVVDEFAALAKEVPEFVEGVVDVALRGRSLGLHLVLATQRPAGVITGQIRANTNLRVALRVSDAEDSDDVVGSPVAAQIERRLPGRAVARIGPQELVPFQSAYVGGHTLANVQPPMVQIRLFGFDHDTRVKEERKVNIPKDHPSDLQRLVANHRRAFKQLGAPFPRKPWLAPLSASYELARLPVSPNDNTIVFGVSDLPARQMQSLSYWHPDADGGLIILGTGGAGKTVALRTIAISAGLAAEASGYPVEVHAIDFAGRGLDMLEDLPHVGTSINGDDTERVTRLLRNMRELIDRRAVEFAAVRASSLPEYRRNHPNGKDAARVIVLLDSYPGFNAVHERIEAGRWLDIYTRLVSDGRGFGVHFVMTADRKAAIPTAIHSAIGRKIVLRLANDDEYSNAGEPEGILSPKSPPGRAIVEGQEVQVAVLGGSGNGERQAAQIAQLATRLAEAGVRESKPIGVLPLEFRRASLEVPSTADRLIFAIGDDQLAPVGLPVEQGSILVTGPPRSGKTTALATLAQAAGSLGAPLFHIHVRPSPLASAPFWGKVAHGPSEGAELLRKVAGVAGRFGKRIFIFVDDLSDLADTETDTELVDLLRMSREHPITVVATSDNQVARRQYSGAIPEMRRNGVGYLLAPDMDTDGDMIGATLPRRIITQWPEGRGFVAERGTAQMAHIALPDAW